MPMDELAFASLDLDMSVDSAGTPGDRNLSTEPSIFAHMIEMNQLLYRILTFNSQVMSESSGLDIIHETSKLSESLEEWYNQLPKTLLYTPEAHLRWAQQGCGRKFTILHINYNYACQLLFFRFLYLCHENTYIPASDLRRLYAERCKKHAAQLCELIQRAINIPESDVMYPLMAHITVIASTIQLFTLLFDPDEVEISRAKARLEQNFALLNQLQEYWPNLDASISKFKAFHLYCLDGQADIFRMDRWLHCFMVDYARSVTKRDNTDINAAEEL